MSSCKIPFVAVSGTTTSVTLQIRPHFREQEHFFPSTVDIWLYSSHRIVGVIIQRVMRWVKQIAKTGQVSDACTVSIRILQGNTPPVWWLIDSFYLQVKFTFLLLGYVITAEYQVIWGFPYVFVRLVEVSPCEDSPAADSSLGDIPVIHERRKACRYPWNIFIYFH